MNTGATDYLNIRVQDDGGLARLVAWSLAAHLAVVAVMALLPPGWLTAQPKPPEIIVISLGGAVGPRSTGTAPIAGKQIDQAVETRRPTPPQPPAQAKPDTMPAPQTKPVTAKPTPPPPQPTTAPPAATTKPPVTGARVQTGTAAADTGASGTNQGLTLTGGAGGGDAVDLNTFDPEWVAKFKDAINRTWNRVQRETGFVVVRFTINRDGSIEGGFSQLQVVESSGSFALDMASKRALQQARLPALPASHKEPVLIVRLRFDYER